MKFYKMDVKDLKINDSVIYNGCIRFIKSINSNIVEFDMPDNHLECCKCAKYGIVSKLESLDESVLFRVIDRLNGPCTPVDDDCACPILLVHNCRVTR